MTAPTTTRSGEDAERSFAWFTPAKRRATIYEDVTVDSQPSVHRHMTRGWLVNFEDGRTTWDPRSTKLAHTDWFDFHDPGGLWERPYFQLSAGYEEQIEHAVRQATIDRLFDDFDPEWVESLRHSLQIPALIDHALWLCMASSARDCLSDTLATAVALEAAMKQRQAQSLVLYAMDLEAVLGQFPIELARERFLSHPAWQPVRRYVERLQTIVDWGEAIVAVNLCFEPIVGVFVRREIGIRAAAAHGDTVTVALARPAQLEWEWMRAWTAAFTRFALNDATHAAANRAVIRAWMDDWLLYARAAVRALKDMAIELPAAVDFRAGLARVERDADRFYRDAAVETLPCTARATTTSGS